MKTSLLVTLLFIACATQAVADEKFPPGWLPLSMLERPLQMQRLRTRDALSGNFGVVASLRKLHLSWITRELEFQCLVTMERENLSRYWSPNQKFCRRQFPSRRSRGVR